MTARCWCGRPVATDVVDAYLCAEHDNPPPRPRPGIPHPGMVASIGLAFLVMVGALLALVVVLSGPYEIQPSPAGPTVVEVQP